MELSELALVLGVFLVIFFAGTSFLGGFGEEAQIPPEISGSWDATVSRIEDARGVVSSSIEKISQGGLAAVAGAFSLAFGGIYFIVASLWSVFISIPSALWGSINYLANTFGVPTQIVLVVSAMITVVVVIKVIQFIVGRSL